MRLREELPPLARSLDICARDTTFQIHDAKFHEDKHLGYDVGPRQVNRCDGEVILRTRV